MITLEASLNECYPAIDESVPRVRRAVAEYAAAAGANDDQLDRVRLAVSEAVTNVVRHAYRIRRGEIHLTANVAGDELWVLVSDDGRGLHRPTQDPGLGWGLALIADVCDEFVITERGEGGTEARMRFRFAAEAAAA